MIDVIKRSGRRQAFSEEKIIGSITASAREAGIADWRTRTIVKDLSRELFSLSTIGNEMKSAVIRDFILASLDVVEPSVSEAWRNYETKKPGRLPTLALLPPARILLLKE